MRRRAAVSRSGSCDVAHEDAQYGDRRRHDGGRDFCRAPDGEVATLVYSHGYYSRNLNGFISAKELTGKVDAVQIGQVVAFDNRCGAGTRKPLKLVTLDICYWVSELT